MTRPIEAILTIDVDWAPDHMIDSVRERLTAKGVKATWFVTHASPAVERLRDHPELFELGIHPNFQPNSSHGRDVDQIMSACLDFAPGARSMRTHGLHQSTNILRRCAGAFGMTLDLSLFLPRHPVVAPVDYHFPEASLARLAYNFEDDFEMMRPTPCFDLDTLAQEIEGVIVFDFHPVHIYLNSPDMENYTRLKSACQDLAGAQPGQTAPFIHRGAGTGVLFEQILSRSGVGLTAYCAGEWAFARLKRG